MARFDEVFSELQAKVGATIAVIAADPELALRVREAMDAAQAADVIAEGQAQDDARANALQNVISSVGAVLREVAPLPTDAQDAPPDAPADPPPAE